VHTWPPSRAPRRSRAAIGAGGEFGVYHAFLGAADGEIDIDGQLADLGERWETPRIAYKPFPACHFMHGSLGGLRKRCAAGS